MVDLPGSIVPIQVSHRISTVAFTNRKQLLGSLDTAQSDVNAEMDSQTDEHEMYLGIHSDFDMDCPQPQFASAPLFGARAHELFLDYFLLRVSAFLSALLAIGAFLLGTDYITAFLFAFFLLYALFWFAVSLDRNILVLLVHQFEYVYCLAMFVVFLVAVVIHGPIVSIALAKYRNVDYSIALFNMLGGDIFWVIGSLLVISYVLLINT